LRELTDKSESEIGAIVKEKLRFVDLENSEKLMPSELSGGMKKRIAVARSLVMNPDLVLFDEPTTGLDPIVGQQVCELIVDLNRKAGVTILAVTHDIQNAFLVASRIAVLDSGKIVAEGSPQAIRESRHPVVARFVATALA
jgi:phospholipid/cholesterol/gamma-HCH transport system ATP-binding protein